MLSVVERVVQVCLLSFTLCFCVAGENCNRGAALGALLGAGGSYSGAIIPQDWKEKLRDAQEFVPDIVKDTQ